jgi:hypothetical protein
MLLLYKFARSSQHQCITRVAIVLCSSLFLPAIVLVRVLVRVIAVANLFFLAIEQSKLHQFCFGLWDAQKHQLACRIKGLQARIYAHLFKLYCHEINHELIVVG